MIRKNILQLLFSGACIWRWNDKLRPVQLAEIEKQAHKMFVACILLHEQTRTMSVNEAARLTQKVIEGALADYFFRLIITDIKPPVFYKIKENRAHYKELAKYTLGRLEPLLSPLGDFWKRMRKWHETDDEAALERRILAAAHLFASQWEFNLIRPHNPFDEEMDSIALSFKEGLEKFRDLPGLAFLLTEGNALHRFANLCGQLRFQIRWTQTPRLPATSVLGHMYMVAATAYLFSLSFAKTRQRANNAFFGGLFHDFPELLTRDIISPVKRSSTGLSELIRSYEEAELERRVLGPLKTAGYGDLADIFSFHLGLPAGSEFQDCWRDESGNLNLCKGTDELNLVESEQYARLGEKMNARDGQLLKQCDMLSAFLEAHNSILNGVSSQALVEARFRIKNELTAAPPDCLAMEALLADFD